MLCSKFELIPIKIGFFMNFQVLKNRCHRFCDNVTNGFLMHIHVLMLCLSHFSILQECLYYINALNKYKGSSSGDAPSIKYCDLLIDKVKDLIDKVCW